MTKTGHQEFWRTYRNIFFFKKVLSDHRPGRHFCSVRHCLSEIVICSLFSVYYKDGKNSRLLARCWIYTIRQVRQISPSNSLSCRSSIRSSGHLSLCPSFCTSICPSVPLTVRLSLYPSYCSSVHLQIAVWLSVCVRRLHEVRVTVVALCERVT